MNKLIDGLKAVPADVRYGRAKKAVYAVVVGLVMMVLAAPAVGGDLLGFDAQFRGQLHAAGLAALVLSVQVYVKANNDV